MHGYSNSTITITVPADPDQDDCLQHAADTYIADHPDLADWDLCPHWADDTREEINLVIPVWGTT